MKNAVYAPPDKREAMPSPGELLSSTPGAMVNAVGSAGSQLVGNLANPETYTKGLGLLQAPLDLANLAFSPITGAATNLLGRPVESATGIRKEITGTLATAALPLGPLGEAASAARALRAGPQLEKGAQFVQDIARKSGTDLTALTPSTKPLMAAENLGPNAQTLGRREGETGGLLAPALAERAAGRSDRVLEDMAQSAGIHPEAAKGNIDALVQAGQAQAKPLFNQALEAPGPVWNADLSRLAQRPAIQKAIKLATEDLKNADINPGTVGLGEDTHLGALADVQYARAPSKKGETIFDAIKKFGGIRLETGASGAPVKEAQEVSNILQDVKSKGLISQYGKTPDYMREALAQDGWFTGNPTNGADIGEFYDALAQQAQGAPYMHPESAGGGAAYARQGLDQEMTQAGITASDSTKDAARKLAAYRVANAPAGQMQPTAQAWDLIRKNLAGTVERDPFGKPIPDAISRGNHNINQATRDLTGALKSAIPGYSDALAVSGDYLSARSAFEQGQKSILNANVTASDFAKVVGKMSPAEVEALKGGIANKLFDMAQNGRLRPAQFLTDKAQAKLAAALGSQQAKAFVQNLEQEASMTAFERRAAPAAGSQTQPLSAAMKEQDQFGASQLAGHAADILMKGHRRATIDYVAPKIQALLDRIGTRGLSVEDRNLAGRLLMLPPEQLNAAIKASHRQPSPPLSLPRYPATPLLLQAPNQSQQ